MIKKENEKHLKLRFKMAAILFRLLLMAPFLFSIFCLSYLPGSFGAKDYKMRDPVVTSRNNSHKADASSNIVWGKVPKTKSISLSNREIYDGLEGLFVISRLFINSALSDKIPVELYEKINSGNFNPVEDIKPVILDHLGLLIAIVVGILFVVFFPVVGVCFCLWRNSGKCGGKMIQPRKERSPFRRKCLTYSLFVGIIFSASGTAFMFASDIRLMDAIKELPTTLPKVMTAFAVYGDNTYTEIKFVGNETIEFLLDVIKRDLNNLDVLVGIPLRDELDKQAKIRSIFSTIRTLASDLKFLENTMKKTDTTIKSLETKANALQTKMNQIKNDIDTDIQNCKNANIQPCQQSSVQTGSLSSSFTPGQMPNISPQIKQISSVDLIGKVQKPEKQFDEIPEKVYNMSQSKVQSVNKILDDAQGILPDLMEKAKKFKTNMDNGMIAGQDLGILTSKSDKLLSKIQPYNELRSKAFIGLAGLCLVLVGLLFSGLFLGVCGQDDTVSPINRGCISNQGGCLLMTGVAFIFIFGWILMLLTTAMFIPGSIVEVYGCKTLRNIGEGSVDNILKVFLKTNFGELAFGNKTFNITISEVYNGCEKGQGIFKAAQLSNIANLDSIFNYPENHGVKNDLSSIKVDLTSVKILTPDLKKQLEDFKKSLNIDFNKYSTELNKLNGPGSLQSLATNLDKLSSLPSPYGSKFKQHAANVRLVESNELKALTDVKNELVIHLDGLKNTAQATSMTITNLLSQMQKAQDVIVNNGNDIVKKVLLQFADRILGIWADFVKYIQSLLNYKIGKCQPITHIYNYVVINMACGIIDSFNAYWFGLGWCLFFLVINLILAVKLAKFFRRMEYSDELDGSNDMGHSSQNGTQNRGNIQRNNKVGQMPRY